MGPEKLIPLTLDEHQELGREMRAATSRLRSLCDLVVGVYGSSNRASFSFLKAMEAIDRLNVDLETQAMEDLSTHPNHGFYCSAVPVPIPHPAHPPRLDGLTIPAAAFLLDPALESDGDDTGAEAIDPVEQGPLIPDS